MSRPIVECACCGVEGQHQGHGYITACYHRWRDAGFPADGPPPAPLRGEALRDEYQFLRSTGESHEGAVTRLRLSSQVARRLRAAYEGDAAPTWRPKKADYLRLRQQGHSRKEAAALIGSPVTATYHWERGVMKTRPRKVAS